MKGYIYRSWDLFWKHLTLGYVNRLIVFDCIAICGVLARDSAMFAMAGHSLERAVRKSIYYHTKLDIITAVIAFTAIAVMLPVFVGMCVVFRTGGAKRSYGRKLRRNIVLHLMLAALLGYGVLIGHSMERLSGYWKMQDVPRSYSFQSWTKGIAVHLFSGRPSSLPYILIVLLGPVLLNIAIPVLIAPQGPMAAWLKAYVSRLQLAYHGSDTVYRRFGRNAINLLGVMSPQLRYIEDKTRALIMRFERAIPGSKESQDVLIAASNECSNMLRSVLYPGLSENDISFSFFPGTTRAIEIAMQRASTCGKIIVSPFEHPTELQAAKWIEAIRGVEIVPMIWEEQRMLRTWSAIMDDIAACVVTEARRNARSKRQKSMVVLMSEVWWSTGLRIPIHECIELIGARLADGGGDSCDIRYIIDGAHAAGNIGQLCELDMVDSYIFSGHKWLLSHDPIGVLVEKARYNYAVQPYDKVDSTLSISTGSARSIFSFLASLYYIRDLQLGSIIEHTRHLKAIFEDRIGNSLEVIGKESSLRGTSLLAVRPLPGKRWARDLTDAVRLGAHLERCGVKAIVLESIGHKKAKQANQIPVVRIAIPHYAHVGDIRRAARVLCSVVE